MNIDREKLRELIGNVQDEGVSYVDCFSDTDKPEHISNDELAHYLISRGVRLETKQAISDKTSDKTSDSKWISDVSAAAAEGGMTMNVLWVVLFLFVYLMIGLVFMGALDTDNEDGAIVLVLFWPCILAVLLLIGMFWLPVKLGMWIKKKINKWL